MRSFGCAQDDNIGGYPERAHYFVILRERSEPKDLLLYFALDLPTPNQPHPITAQSEPQ